LGRTGLSRKELKRVEVMSRVKARSLRLQEAAELLELSYRQAKRIWARYRAGERNLPACSFTLSTVLPAVVPPARISRR
jgi:hypothetical protein